MVASIILPNTMTTDIFGKSAKETSRILLFLEIIKAKDQNSQMSCSITFSCQ